MDAAGRAGCAAIASTSHQTCRLRDLAAASFKPKEILPFPLSLSSTNRGLSYDGPIQESLQICACSSWVGDRNHPADWLEHDPTANSCLSSFLLNHSHWSGPILQRGRTPRSVLSNSASTDDYISQNRIQQDLKTPANRVSSAAREVCKDIRSQAAKINGTSKLDVVQNGAAHAGETVVPTLKRPFTDFLATVATMILAVEKQRRKEGIAALTVSVDSLRRGSLVDSDLVYRQQFVIRSYEVSYDRTASIETLTNLFQETALNHVGMSDFVGDGMGTTHAMMRHRLIWVVTRMHIKVDRYPVWGDIVEIDSWVCGAGKNGMRRDFLVTDYATGHVLARATSTWVMMNQDTRRLSKMPDDVRAEISPYFLDRSVLDDGPTQKIPKLDDCAPYIRSDLVPRLNDMDMNQHVNNVKYIGWVLESVPQSLLVAHELTSMILEYRRECSHSDVVQSMTGPESDPSLDSPRSTTGGANGVVNGSAHGSTNGSVNGHKSSLATAQVQNPCPVQYTHLLRMQSDHTEIVRGRTVWRLKKRYFQ